MLSRRTLLKLLSVLTVPLFPGGASAMGKYFYVQDKKRGGGIVVKDGAAEPRSAANRFVKDGLALVSISGYGTVEDMVRESVGLIGGFSRLELSGKTVLVKPNVVSGEKSPATTSPEVVAAVVRILYAEGARKVYVGDMSAFATLSTSRNMKKTGIHKAAVDNGAEPVIFEDHAWVEVRLPGNEIVKKAYVTEWLYNVDLIINLPVIKTHRSASYSITLKNFIGCTHLKQRPYFIDPSRWEEIVAEFNAAYAPDLNIVDGTVSMIEGGPWEGTPAETRVIIASGDRIAADVAGLGVIKSFGKWPMVADRDVWEQRQIKRALSLGLGKGKKDIRLLQGASPIWDERFTRLVDSVRRHAGLQTGGLF